MGFRTVVVTKQCKCSYKCGYLVVMDEEVNSIHLSEIDTVVFDTTAVSLTAYLLNELIKRKITIIFCDNKHMPYATLNSLAGSHNSSKRVKDQVVWGQKVKDEAWQYIVKEKILNQAECLYKNGRDGYQQLVEYANAVELADSTNREGHAAKVYFNCLFGKKWVRGADDCVNISLDYGYALLLSAVAKEIVANGYITQLGINHCNEYNEFNLACDLMEPFRPLVDQVVLDIAPENFDINVKSAMLNFLNQELTYKESSYYMTVVIRLYVSNALRSISEGVAGRIIFPERPCESELCVR